MHHSLQSVVTEDTEPGVVKRPGRTILLVVVSIWMSMVGIAFAALLVYHNMPGDRRDHGAIWPANNAIKMDSQRANLVVFIHPQCPCSTATLNELARIQSTCGNRVNIQAVFYCPSDKHWEDTSKVRQALTIPNVHITNDVDGKLAKRFGVQTSGHSLLYTSDGRKVFSGGITPARGHEGENLGRSSIVSYVLEGETTCNITNVFGCPILDSPSDVVINNRGSRHGIE